MNDFDVMGRIKELCKARSWSYYRLAKESGIPILHPKHHAPQDLCAHGPLPDEDL